MLQYQPKLYQICPSAYGVDATSIRISKSQVGGGGNNRKVPLIFFNKHFSPSLFSSVSAAEVSRQIDTIIVIQ